MIHTTNIATKGETGRFPLAIIALMLTIKYWFKLKDASNPSHCNNLSILSLKDTERVPNSFNIHMKSLLETLGFGHLWVNKTTFFLRRTISSLKSKLSERYTSYFKSVIKEETKVKGRYITKLRTYELFKTVVKKENCLSLPLDKQSKKTSNDQELIQSDPTSRPQGQKGNNQIHELTAVYERHFR